SRRPTRRVSEKVAEADKKVNLTIGAIRDQNRFPHRVRSNSPTWLWNFAPGRRLISMPTVLKLPVMATTGPSTSASATPQLQSGAWEKGPDSHFYLFFLYNWITYMSVVSTLAFVVFFAIGPGTIPWIYTAELFAQGPRPAAMAIGVLVNWSANFFVSLVFPFMQGAFGDYTFLPFTALLGLFWVFTYRRVPETKNRTFDEIASLFRQQGSDACQPRTPGESGCTSSAGRSSQAVSNSCSQSQPVTPTCPHQQDTPGHLIHSGLHNHNFNHIGYGHTQTPQQRVVINSHNGGRPGCMKQPGMALTVLENGGTPKTDPRSLTPDPFSETSSAVEH
ncbi:solute carrier family 2, partial [Tropilaelaps mercedesae]